MHRLHMQNLHGSRSVYLNRIYTMCIKMTKINTIHAVFVQFAVSLKSTPCTIQSSPVESRFVKTLQLAPCTGYLTVLHRLSRESEDSTSHLPFEIPSDLIYIASPYLNSKAVYMYNTMHLHSLQVNYWCIHCRDTIIQLAICSNMETFSYSCVNKLHAYGN